MHITIRPNKAIEASDESCPTAQTYGELHVAYAHFNAELFDGALPPCLITLQRRSRRVHGYYASKRFRSNRQPDRTADEIALNPVYFESRNVIEVLQTLAHEMVHKWQHHFGKPSRSGYHNREWAAKMVAIGLHPSSTGKPGGKMVGQRMADYLVEGGPLARAIDGLIRQGFRISWYELDRISVVVMRPPEAGLAPALSGVRVKYTCPACGLNAWAKPRTRLICADCRHLMMPWPRGGGSEAAPKPTKPVLVLVPSAVGETLSIPHRASETTT